MEKIKTSIERVDNMIWKTERDRLQTLVPWRESTIRWLGILLFFVWFYVAGRTGFASVGSLLLLGLVFLFGMALQENRLRVAGKKIVQLT